MSTDSFAEIVGETDDAIYQIRTRAPGPSGKLPLTIEQVVEAPSGHIFGYSQNAGMGWNPDELGPGRVPHRQYAGRHPRPRRPADRAGLPHRPLGNRSADGGCGRGNPP